MANADLCRRNGLSPAASYKLKAKFGRMEVSDAKRLKRSLAESLFDQAALEDLLSQKW